MIIDRVLGEREMGSCVSKGTKFYLHKISSKDLQYSIALTVNNNVLYLETC